MFQKRKKKKRRWRQWRHQLRSPPLLPSDSSPSHITKKVFSFEKMVFKEKYQYKVTITTRIALRQLHSAPLSVSLSYGFKNPALNVKQCLVPKIVFTHLKRLIMLVEGRSKKQNKIKTMVLK